MKVKPWLALLGICMVSSTLRAQFYTQPTMTWIANATGTKACFLAGAHVSLASTGIDGRGLYKLVNDPFFDESDKNTITKNLKDRTRFGVGTSQYLTASVGDTSGTMHSLTFTSTLRYGVSLRKEAVIIFLYGNDTLKGEKINLDKSRFTQVRYSTLMYNFAKPLKKGFTIGAGIGPAFGERLVDIDISNGSLFTSQDADSLSLEILGSVQASTPVPKLNILGGAGASLNLYGAYAPPSKPGVNYQLAITDLGFIAWGKGAGRSLGVDLNVNYIGFQPNGNNANIVSLIDTVNYLTKAGKRSFISGLPATFTFRGDWPLTTKLGLTAGVQYVRIVGQLPALHASGLYALSNTFRLRFGGQVLGAGLYGTTLGFDGLFANGKLKASLSTENLEGFVVPSVARGFSIQGSLAFRVL